MTDAPDLDTMVEALPAEMQSRMRERMAGLDEGGRVRMQQRLASMYEQMDSSTREQMLKHIGLMREIQNGAPEVGEVAYDFDLRRLDGEGRVKLSDSEGRPVGLIFGSYT